MKPDTLPEPVQDQLALRRRMPTQADVRAAFPGKVIDHPDGTWEVNLKSKRDRLKWSEIKRPWNRTAGEVLQAQNARTERVRMVGGGTDRHVPLHLAEYCEQRGLRVPTYLGRRRRICDGSDYDPSRPLRTSAEIRWGEP